MIRDHLKGLRLMTLFLTRIPLRYSHEYREEDFIRGIKTTPLIGLLIGIIIALPNLLTSFLDKPVIVLLIWMLYVSVTGGLHIDGFTDTIDAVFSNRDKEKMLEIMSDSRIGAFGMMGFTYMLLANLILSYYISYEFFIILPVVGRTCSLLAASISSYAKESFGMGTHYIENSKLRDVVFGNILILILVLLLELSLLVMVTVFLTELVVVFSTRYIKKKIGGMTGDTIGFTIEFSQCMCLFFFYILVKAI